MEVLNFLIEVGSKIAECRGNSVGDMKRKRWEQLSL